MVLLSHCSFAFVEFSDSAAVDAVLKQSDWEMEGRPLRLERAGGGGGGRGGGGGGGDGGQSRFQSTYHCCFAKILFRSTSASVHGASNKLGE